MLIFHLKPQDQQLLNTRDIFLVKRKAQSTLQKVIISAKYCQSLFIQSSVMAYSNQKPVIINMLASSVPLKSIRSMLMGLVELSTID